MDSTSAYARARAFLKFSSGPAWVARVCAVLSGLTAPALLLVLLLFSDLIVSRGRIPAYSDLLASRRASADGEMRALVESGRAVEALTAVKVSEADRAATMADAFPPKTEVGREWLWRATVHDLLQRRVGERAAAEYARLTDPATARTPVPDAAPLGLLSLVVRRHSFGQWALGQVAAYNPWTWLPSADGGPNLLYLTGLFVLALVLVLVRYALTMRMNLSAVTAALDLATRLRRAVYHRTYRLGVLTLKPGGSREAMAAFGKHVELIYDAVVAELTIWIREPVQLVTVLALALVVNWWLALAFGLFAVVAILAGGQIVAVAKQRARHAARRAVGQLELLRESLSLMRLVKSNLMDAFNQSRVERQLADFSRLGFRQLWAESLAGPALVALGLASAAILAYVAGRAVLNDGLGAGSLFGLTVALAAAVGPLRSVLGQRKIRRKAHESAGELFELLDRKGEVGQDAAAEFLPGVTKKIEFRGVRLRDPETGQMILDGVDMAIDAGQRVAVRGGDEMEKHSLVYLLLRFLDPTSGDVRIDGKDVRWLTLDSLRSQIGLVSQDDLIFNDTVANNIGCGVPSVTLPQIVEAAKLAHAHQFIQNLPDGYETPIGELGSALRPGEKYRIALARAFLRDPSVYVIEEPKVPLDDETKGVIDDALERMLPGKTVIFLPHRISTINRCDRVYFVHKGRVVAEGDHKDMLNRVESYRHLHYLEFNEILARKA